MVLVSQTPFWKVYELSPHTAGTSGAAAVADA